MPEQDHTQAAAAKIEQLMTIRKAAKVLNIQYRQLLTGVETGQIPFYRIANSRRMVLPSEVLVSMRLLNPKDKGDYHD